jgi:hypothetical protein
MRGIQPGQPKLVPALPPLFNAVQMDHELVRSLLQPSAPGLNRKIPCARIRVRKGMKLRPNVLPWSC